MLTWGGVPSDRAARLDLDNRAMTPTFQRLISALQAKEDEQVQLEPETAHLLKAYVERFLQGSYNILMTGLQKDLDPGLNISRLSNEDFLRFFKLTAFFTGYVRLQEVGVPSATSLIVGVLQPVPAAQRNNKLI